MKIKRFIAKDTRAAMRKVRDALGANAMILSNNSVADGVEIICGIEPEQEQTMAKADSSNERWLEDPVIVAMRSELKSLRGLLENQLCDLAWHDKQQRKPMEAGIIRRFVAMGFHLSLAQKMAGAAIEIMPNCPDIEQVWREALDKAAAMIPIAKTDLLTDSRVSAFVGATGVGKTSTIAKLAARYVLDHGSTSLGLITLDYQRIAASEQLRAYSRILGVPLRVVDSKESLLKTVNAYTDKKCILIDTPGINPVATQVQEQCELLSAAGVQLNRYLVLPATAQQSLLDVTINAFGKDELAACVLSKIDESACLGSCLSAVIINNLAISYITDGQNVPNDLKHACAQYLISKAVQLSNIGAAERSSDEHLALQFKEVMVNAR